MLSRFGILSIVWLLLGLVCVSSVAHGDWTSMNAARDNALYWDNMSGGHTAAMDEYEDALNREFACNGARSSITGGPNWQDDLADFDGYMELVVEYLHHTSNTYNCNYVQADWYDWRVLGGQLFNDGEEQRLIGMPTNLDLAEDFFDDSAIAYGAAHNLSLTFFDSLDTARANLDLAEGILSQYQ